MSLKGEQNKKVPPSPSLFFFFGIPFFRFLSRQYIQRGIFFFQGEKNCPGKQGEKNLANKTEASHFKVWISFKFLPRRARPLSSIPATLFRFFILQTLSCWRRSYQSFSPAFFTPVSFRDTFLPFFGFNLYLFPFDHYLRWRFPFKIQEGSSRGTHESVFSLQ